MAARVIVSCIAPLGVGGVGQHFSHVARENEACGVVELISASHFAKRHSGARTVPFQAVPAVLSISPLRWRTDWRTYIERRCFDLAVSALALGRGRRFVAFSTQAELSFHAHRKAFDELVLVSPTVHLATARDWERELITNRIEKGWLSDALVEVAEREYELADVIEVPSRLALETFVERGIPASRLVLSSPSIPSRFSPGTKDKKILLVYVGALSQAKGTDILLSAFAKLQHLDARLHLIGGPTSRAMFELVNSHVRMDHRISVSAGDPLEVLRAAHILVHPSVHDGFGFGPLEGLRCGAYVIASDRTGMKEYILEGENGGVVRAGDVDALASAIAVAHDAFAQPRGETRNRLSCTVSSPPK